MTQRVLIWLVVICAASSTASAGDLETQRLEHLARLWGKVEYLHPKLAYENIDWDAALVDAIPKVRAAKSADEYAAAVRSMLAALDDERASVERADDKPDDPAAASATLSRAGKGDEVLVATVRGDDYATVMSGLGMLPNQVGDARALVLDVRGAGPESMWMVGYLLTRMQSSLTSKPLTLPADRVRIWSGYPPQSMGGTSGGYTTGFRTRAADVVEPAAEGKGKRVVFLAEPDTELPALAVALQDSRQGAVVVEGANEYSIGEQRLEVDMGEGLTAYFTATETVYRGATPVLRADRRVAARSKGNDLGMKAALRLAEARRLPRHRVKRGSELPAARWKRDETYEDEDLPSAEHRLLALFRLWTVIDLFYPYGHLIEWDGALADYIPKFLAADTAEQYAETVMEMSTLVADGHTRVSGGGADEIRGEASAPILVRFFEHQPVVEAIADPAADKAGLAVGDVIVKVDGKPVREVLRDVGRMVPASHRVAWGYYTARRMLRGPKDSEVTLTVRGANGKRRDVTLKRTHPYPSYREPDKSYRLLDDDTGYAHLGKLTKAEVAPMFEKFKDTDAIIFDLRNYPRGTAWSIAPRLNRKDGTTFAAEFRRCLVEPDDDEGSARLLFRQPIPRSDEWKYGGRVVVLIDERAISQSEHTAMFFEAATDAVFIGTKTAGANGDVTNLCLPGGLCMYFTGHDVRHADGRQLQRVGIQPHIRVRPTIADVRAGRDRVLQRARKYLRKARR